MNREQALREQLNTRHGHELECFAIPLGPHTVGLAAGFPAVSVFVNDRVDRAVLHPGGRHRTARSGQHRPYHQGARRRGGVRPIGPRRPLAQARGDEHGQGPPRSSRADQAARPPRQLREPWRPISRKATCSRTTRSTGCCSAGRSLSPARPDAPTTPSGHGRSQFVTGCRRGAGRAALSAGTPSGAAPKCRATGGGPGDPRRWRRSGWPGP